MRLTLVVSVALAAGVAAQSEQAVDPLEDLFIRGRAAQESMSHLSATFTETSISPLLVDPLIATGRVTATNQPLHVVMEYSTPEIRTVTLDQTWLVVEWPGRSEREEVNIAQIQSRVQKYFTDASLRDLRRSFDITYAPAPEAGEGTARLTMVPKRRQITAGLSRLELWIEPVRLLLVRMQMEFPSGDVKRFDFRDFRVTGPSQSSVTLVSPLLLEAPRAAGR
jgi:hypothetical protein